MRQLPFVWLLSVSAFAQSGDLGIFSNSGDVGGPAIKGSVEFSNGQYRISGSGANIWAKQDQFQYVWREMTGNFTITATMHFVGEGAEHRKAGIMVRQSLDTDATYADVVVHDGMPALQWRSKQGEDTNTFDLPFDGPGTFKLKLVRTGVKIYMYIVKDDAEPRFPALVGPLDRKGRRLAEEAPGGAEVTVTARSHDGDFTPLLGFGPAAGLAARAAEALGVRDGLTSTRVRLGPDGPRVVELHTEPSDREVELARLLHGIDLHALTLDAALGQPSAAEYVRFGTADAQVA